MNNACNKERISSTALVDWMELLGGYTIHEASLALTKYYSYSLFLMISLLHG